MNLKRINLIHKKHLKNYLWAVIGLTPFISFMFGYITLYKLFQPKTFTTPAIVGKKLQEAISILSNHTLNARLLSYKQEPDLPNNTVLSQKPIAGRAIKANQAVYIVISKKPHKIACPNLINEHKEIIAQKLSKKNIRNRSYYLPSNYPFDHCIAQHPAPGTPLKKNNIISYISQGSEKPIIFPDFRGKNLQKVRTFLNQYKNITVETIDDNSDKYPHKNSELDEQNFTIIDQRPIAGSIINLTHISASNKLLVRLKKYQKT